VYAKAPNNQYKKDKCEKENDAVRNSLGTPGQSGDKKLHRNVSPKKEREGIGERYCHQLRKHHHVNGTKDRLKKELGSDYIDARDKHQQQESGKPDPLKPAA